MRALLFAGKHRKNESSTREGQTLPKAVREAAGIRPGDRLTMRVRPEGGVIIEAEEAVKSAEGYMSRLEDEPPAANRSPFANQRPLFTGTTAGATKDVLVNQSTRT
jgi:bifunctional DNA-binding transcriptional regulator/antitoxin component of YhaV-PrlF toxin-antitoxin module